MQLNLRETHPSMAQIRLQPPENPSILNSPTNGVVGEGGLNNFAPLNSGLNADPELKQVSTFLYCMGEEAEVVLASTNITVEERKAYATVCQKFDEFFQVRRNVIFERARFNRRNQLEGEPAEKYIMELYHLTENCEYGDLTSQMIRDRLVAWYSR